MQFPFLFGKLKRYLINLFAYCENEWSWNHFYAAGFPDFRSTRHAKHSGKHSLINSISSIFSVSINIRVLVLRTIFHVARLSADQRAIQKKDECCFSIFYKKQLHKEELTGQSKWGQRCMGSWIAVLYWIWIEIALNLNNWIQPTGNDSRLLSKITYLTAISRLWLIWPAICSWKKVFLFIIV